MAPSVMNTRIQQAFVWCGPVGIVLFGIGLWLMAGMLPPPSPDDGAEEIVEVYLDHPDAVRIGLVTMMVAGVLTAPWAAVISTQIRRVTGPDSPLPGLQLGVGMVGMIVFFLPVCLMQAATFRAERDPELILAISDMAWLPFIGLFVMAATQCVAIALAAFSDPDGSVFPRWVGYVNAWIATLLLPGALISFFKTGPLAWDGAIGFYLPATVFGGWFFAMAVPLLAAIRRQAAAPTPQEVP